MDEIEIQDISWSWITRDFDIDPSDVVDLELVEISLGVYLRISYQKGKLHLLQRDIPWAKR